MTVSSDGTANTLLPSAERERDFATSLSNIIRAYGDQQFEYMHIISVVMSSPDLSHDYPGLTGHVVAVVSTVNQMLANSCRHF